MTYTPVSLAYAERLILDYTTMRALATTPDAANQWLRSHIARLHTQAMEYERLSTSLPTGKLFPIDGNSTVVHHNVHDKVTGL